MGKQLLTINEAVREFGVTVYFLRKGVQNGLIPFVRTSERGQLYICREGLERFLKEGKAS